MIGEDKKKYSVERLDEAVAEVTQLAKTQGLNIALCGGLALQSYGSPRLTKNVDVVADREVVGLDIERPFTFGGFQGRTRNGVPVGVIVRTDGYKGLYEISLAEAVGHFDFPCPVVRPAYLAAMKLAARRPLDTFDLHWLVTCSPPVLDIEAARGIVHRWVGGQFAVQTFDREVDLAELAAARERRVRGEIEK